MKLSAAQEALQGEALERLADCRLHKASRQADIREGYFFTAPQRCADISSQTETPVSQVTAAGELQTSLGIECAEDFVNEVVESFMPESVEWCEQESAVALEDEDLAEIKDQIAGQTALIHGYMKETRFYSEVSQTFKADLPVGTVGIWIDKPPGRIGDAAQVRSVPLKELEINVGPDGKIDDRFVVRHTRCRNLPAMIDKALIPKEMNYEDKAGRNKKCCLIWGFWRDWSAAGVAWKAVILIDNKLVWNRVLTGDGSCPLIVARMDPDPAYPYGEGPVLKALPELRRLDEMEALEVEGYDFKVHPAFAYPDDGNINFSAGIEPGMGYPMRMGPGQEPKSLTFDSDVQYAEYVRQRVEMRIKRLFYVDYPEQRGKTPPTAAQWLDEMAMRQRRLGRPGKIFWEEGPMEYFKRFRFLLDQMGMIKKITVNGKEMPLRAYNPTEKAKEHQEILQAERLLQLANGAFPQVAQVIVNGEATIQNIKTKLRDTIVVLRAPEELKQTIQTLAPILGGGGGAAAGEAPDAGMLPA